MITKIANYLRYLLGCLKSRYGLSAGGERVDIEPIDLIDYDKLDIYQKSHLRRYQYALSLIPEACSLADFACGTGYGSMILAEKAADITAMDIDKRVIKAIKKRYQFQTKVNFLAGDLLSLNFHDRFDVIVSFETIEHFSESDIVPLLKLYFRSLKANGILIFSVPYKQERSENAVKMGFHLTFDIDELKINSFLTASGFSLISYHYQNYLTHDILNDQPVKDFIICVAKKNL